MKVLILDAAGKEFVKRTVKLYKSVKYYGVKEMLGKQLLDSAIDSGRLLEETHKCSGLDKRNAAINARASVRRTLYLTELMIESGYYTRRRVAPVGVMGEALINTLDYYITSYDAAAEMKAPVRVVREIVKEPYDPYGFDDEYRG